jgi:2-C-methyl-D-erythritol 2,4-cyclodiphosphate synthase
MRIGIGYDIHRLVPGRKLVLGGVAIPYEQGLMGHSDADVVVHALCDALLGAAGLGDIGQHFPDTDPAYKNADSLQFLYHVRGRIAALGYDVGNADATIFAERPKITPYKKAMQAKLAQALMIAPEQINIKATTTEGLGVVGRGAGIGAMCVVLLEARHTR